MRTAFSRLLLVGLLGVAVFAVVQLSSGPAGAVVALTGLGPDELASETFRLDGPARLALDVAGSYEEAGAPASDTTLAAYGWIVRRDDDTVAWQMRAPRPERGTLVLVRDTIDLGPGTYTAYFTSYGDPLVRAEPQGESLGDRVREFLSRGGRTWVGDAGRWRLLAEAVGPADVDRDTAPPSPPADVVWEGLEVHDRQRREGLLHVRQATTVGVGVVTEITDGVVADVGSIVRLGARDTVWTTAGPGVWAGGSLKNRALTDSVALEPGFYRVAFEADRSHAFDDWTANPPLRPYAWGLRLSGDARAVGPLDASDVGLPVVVQFTCVGPDAEHDATFTLSAPTDLLVVAVGEITSGTAYDYARLDRYDDGDWDDVWDQEDADLAPAGGADKNRLAVEALSLEPGEYRLRYRTDGSHDCVSGYNNGGPPDGGMWGAALYALAPALDIAALGVETQTTSHGDSDDGGGDEAPDLVLPSADRLLASIDEVGDNASESRPFTVPAEGRVHVVALGEISSSTRYDYAQITRPGGAVVWEMTWENTRAGGGSLFHRQFHGDVRLPPGAYVLRYTTDGSRSFGDFGPDSRVLWGVRVYRPGDGTAPPAPPTPPDPTVTPPPPPAPPDGPEVLERAAVPPRVVGGLAALQGRARYPELARRSGIEGEVVVQFVVTETGAAVDPQIVRSPNDLLSEAAIQAVLGSQFVPGLEGGRPVRVRFTVPVTFALD